MEKITSKLIEEGIITKEHEEKEDEFGNSYISYCINEDWLFIFNSDIMINGYVENYKDGELDSITLFDSYDTNIIYSRENFISYIEIYKKSNIF